MVKIFMGGDVFSSPGIRAVQKAMPILREQYAPDFVIFNGENASGGNGLLQQDAELLFAAGIDVLSGGNHIFEKRDAYPFLESDPRVLRPQNYPDAVSALLPNSGNTPGRGFALYTKDGITYAVLNIQGRENLFPLDCPFKAAAAAATAAAENNALFVVDFHAESNREKESMGLFLDGKAVAVCGTHTHIQTADERILPSGTAYITDLGMSGAADSVIGTKPEISIKRNVTQVMYKMENAEYPVYIQGVLITADPVARKALAVERISLAVSEPELEQELASKAQQTK